MSGFAKAGFEEPLVNGACFMWLCDSKIKDL